MGARYGTSPWVHLFPESRRRSFPRLRGDHTADVVIVGGGLTGCTTAYLAAMAGMRPCVIEADRIGQGRAGRGPGLLLPSPDPPFRDVVNAHGLRAARAIFESWRLGSLEAAAFLRRLGVKCGLEPQDDLHVALASDAKLLRREYDARKSAGLNVRWLPEKTVRLRARLESPGAMAQQGGFALDPHRACLGIASAAMTRGARFFERSGATRIRFGRKGVEVQTGDALVQAARVVVTTATATQEIKALRRHFKRRQGYGVLTEPMAAATRKQMLDAGITLADTAAPRHRVRWTTDGRMLVTGADQDEPPARSRDAVLRQRTGQLMYELLTMYPVISGLRPAYGWDVTYGQTADGLMYVGPHRNFPHHLFALGGSAESVTGSFVAARILARALTGGAVKGDDLLGWTR